MTVHRVAKTAAAALTVVATACATPRSLAARQIAVQPDSGCTIAAAAPWITKWLSAWQLTSKTILRIPDVPPPDFVFFDTKCVYTTSAVAAPTQPVPGPSLGGAKLSWRVAPHHDTLTMPNGNRRPLALLTFADEDKRTRRPYFVMAAPSYWESKGLPGDVTPVFLHEFTHTRQMKGFGPIIGPIDSTWKSKFPYDLNDDAVQNQFKSDSAYVAAYLAERDLLYRAAESDSLPRVRALAAEALAMMRARHERWFTGENAVFSVLDDIWLSAEGAAQWAAHAWLAHPSGGGMTKPAAVARMLGRRRVWSQDEGLGLFLVLDRLMPNWPSLVFSDSSIGGITLLERALRQ